MLAGSDTVQNGGERGEASMAEWLAPQCKNVLELGAGKHANVSKVLQRKLLYPSRHVAVETNPTAATAHSQLMQVELHVLST